MTDKNPPNPSTRSRPPALRALGGDDPPQQIELAGRTYQRIDIFKHDSMAATALYDGPDGKVVCKFDRLAPFGFIPLNWLGRWLAEREARALRMLSDLPCVPEDLGPVTVDGRVWRTAVAHRYIEGRPLVKKQLVHDQFFPQLRQTLRAIHERGMAYLDLNKRENIIVDEQGDPHLIDFQVYFRLSRRWPGSSRPMRALLRSLQRADDYHLLKHHRQFRRDQLSDAEKDLDALRPPWIRFWRRWYTPLKNLRRRWLVRAGIRTGRGLPNTERDPEHVHRQGGGSPASHT